MTGQFIFEEAKKKMKLNEPAREVEIEQTKRLSIKYAKLYSAKQKSYQ